jgi:hypothetical protein
MTSTDQADTRPKSDGYTLCHVTHEAVDHIGGIGTVLEGLMISPVYKKHVKRSILIGPTATHIATDPQDRLGAHGQVLYSSIDNIDINNLASRFQPVEWAFNVKIVYGKRQYERPGTGRTGESEVLLIDVFQPNTDRLNVFKHRLWETFNLDSGRYEKAWDYEEYVRLAEPAFYALMALKDKNEQPWVMFGHEFMGMPSVLQAILDGNGDFYTVFHAHECATARRLVEDHPGHDTMFYNVLDQAQSQGLYVDDVFSNLNKLLRHALVSRSHLCDGIIAVGDRTRDELKFLTAKFDDEPIDLVYNGLPLLQMSLKEKLASRKMLLEYATKLIGQEPDLLMTHVTRPVISKGLWRDLKVCHALNDRLVKENKKAILFILTSGAGVRRKHDIRHMEHRYGWPRHHQEGYPDLVGPEIDLNNDVEAFNANHTAVQIIVVNQFGWSHDCIGDQLPANMDIADLRRATDVEFGMATYEPFGISPLEPLGAGAICVITNVCGCSGFVKHATEGKGTPLVIEADFTQLQTPRNIEALLAMTQQDRDQIEQQVSEHIANTLLDRVPWDDDQRSQLLDLGQELIQQMGWDQVIQDGLLPILQRISTEAKVSD